MKGKYFICLKDKMVDFKIDIDRQFTIIRGNSSTGKSFFVDMLREYLINKKNGIMPAAKLTTNFNEIYVVTPTDDFNKIVEIKKNCLILMDEDCNYLFDGNFGSRVKHSDNYFMIVTRKKLSDIPYSVFSIYDFESEIKSERGKYFTETRLKPLYADADGQYNLDCLLTEDSGSGYDLFKNSLNCEVISAGGNTRVYKESKRLFKEKKNLGILVDSSAFGPYMVELYEYFIEELKKVRNKNVYIFLPESFEYLVLRTRYFRNDGLVRSVLEKPYNYCETTKFFSYERMFTNLLTSKCRDKNIKYNKGKRDSSCSAMLESISDEILGILGVNKE